MNQQQTTESTETPIFDALCLERLRAELENWGRP